MFREVKNKRTVVCIHYYTCSMPVVCASHLATYRQKRKRFWFFLSFAGQVTPPLIAARRFLVQYDKRIRPWPTTQLPVARLRHWRAMRSKEGNLSTDVFHFDCALVDCETNHKLTIEPRNVSTVGGCKLLRPPTVLICFWICFSHATELYHCQEQWLGLSGTPFMYMP